MSTQFMTIDTAACVSFPGQEATEPAHAGAPPDTYRLGDNDFSKGKSISELAREQGVGPVKDISIFAGVIPEDVDVDEVLAQLEAMRGSAPRRDEAIRARLVDVDRQEEKRRRLQAFLKKGDSRMESRQPPRNRRGWRGICMGKEATQRGRAGF